MLSSAAPDVAFNWPPRPRCTTRDDLFTVAAQSGVDPTSLMANMVIPPDHATDRVPLTRKLLARLAKMPALTGSTVTTIPVYVVDQAWTAGLARVFFAPLPPGAPWRFDVHIYTFDAGFAAAHGINNDAPDTPGRHPVQVKLQPVPVDRWRPLPQFPPRSPHAGYSFVTMFHEVRASIQQMRDQRHEPVQYAPLNLSPKDSLKSLEFKMTTRIRQDTSTPPPPLTLIITKLLDVPMQNDLFSTRDAEKLVLATEWDAEVMGIDVSTTTGEYSHLEQDGKESGDVEGVDGQDDAAPASKRSRTSDSSSRRLSDSEFLMGIKEVFQSVATADSKPVLTAALEWVQDAYNDNEEYQIDVATRLTGDQALRVMAVSESKRKRVLEFFIQ
ncbi:hypothetical protein H9P43_006781 [Blastocladiella emersonii ATCC 22665]|nr:hypothetical protein H9P43_006781 [Blastocladiella emersonii ATCC 22665]